MKEIQAQKKAGGRVSGGMGGGYNPGGMGGGSSYKAPTAIPQKET